MNNPKDQETKTLRDIIVNGLTWQNDLSVVLTDLCKRVEEIEKK